MRHLRFWVGYFLRYYVLSLFGPLLKWGLGRLGTHRSFEGITLVAAPVREGEAEPPFLRCTAETLQLIRSVDPRRFRRLQREISMIEESPGLALGLYNRPLRCCSIDFARYDPERWREHPEWSRWLYATTLVHEATHGAVYSRHVMYTRALRARIERLCCTEARRFATRADREDRQWSDALVPPFDEQRWHESWHSTVFQRTKQLIARVQEVAASAKTKP